MPSDAAQPPVNSSRRGSSPYSTGGGGVTLERRVAALYLAKLLTGATSVELEGRRVTRVEFQQVDDLVIHAARDGDAETSLELAVAVRRAPDFVTSESKTEKLLTKLLQALSDAGTADTGVERRLAICVAGPQTASRQVEELADLAKDHDADSFFELRAVHASPRRSRRLGLRTPPQCSWLGRAEEARSRRPR